MECQSVYCIIVTYNGIRWIDQCLQGLRNSTYPVSCIIVDNASGDGTTSHIAVNYPEVILLRERSNLGFGQANNKGINYALEQKAGYIFLLNQDVYIDPNTIAVLIDLMRENPGIGILSPVHLTGDGKRLDDHFHFYLSKAKIGDFLFDCIKTRSPGTDIVFTPFVNAAAWMLTARCVQTTGGFDPIFFHYGEDDNYALRARYKGFQMAISTQSFVRHDHDRSNEQPAGKIEKVSEKEFLNLLNQFCDPHLSDFRYTYYKRLSRHILSAVVFGLRGKGKSYLFHRSIAVRLIRSYKKISKSRLAAKLTPTGVFLS